MPPNDATIDIPLEQVQVTREGTLRNQNSTSALRPSTSNESPTTKSKRPFLLKGRRQQGSGSGDKKKTGRVGYDGEEDTVNAMGRIYRKIRDFSVITRYMFYVVPIAALIAIPLIVGATAAPKAKIGGVRLVWFFAWVEIVWASLWVSKIVAHFLPIFFEIFAGFVSSGVRKYSMVLRSLEIPLSLVGWAVASLATFVPVMTGNPDNRGEPGGQKKWETIVQSILAAATISSVIFLGEKFIIQLISIDYHRKQFYYRIKESKRNIHLFSLLYDASRHLFPAYCNEFAEEDYIISDQLTASLGLGNKNRSHDRSGSRTPMRVLHDIGRAGDKITSAFGKVAHEVTGKQIFDPNSSHSIVIEALERPRSAEALAKRVWMSFVVESRDALYQDDVMDVLGPDRRSEAEEAFASLDQDGNGDISLDEMIMVVTEYGRERKSIATSMHDVDQAINVLDNLFSAVVFIAVILTFVAFLNRNFVTTLATTGTALLSLSFVFAGTCQEVLGSCIFVFVKHPYDVGDRIDLGADQFVVEHISLLFTIFKRTSGANIGRSVQIPNIVLNTLWVENISRSKAMSEQFDIAVSFDTSFEDIQILKNELSSFVTDKDNSRDFQPDLEVGILGTTDQSKLTLQVEIRHKSNWSNETVRQARRSKFMCALVSALRKVPIYAPGGGGKPLGDAANPSYSVAIANELAQHNMEEAAKVKEQARLIPTKKIEAALSPVSSGRSGAAGLTARDNAIVSDLTSRNPAVDLARDQAWTSSREDDSTLGERPSIDQQDLDEVRGLLRRESTRGKRKAGGGMQAPSVPTISEPGATGYTDYGQSPAYAPSTGGYQSTGYSSTPTAYVPPPRSQPVGSQVQPPQLPQLSTQTSPIEMRQVSRNPSNPYRKRDESASRKPMSPSGGPSGSFENTRPYSGV
ncbi:hypothetical protein LTR22_002399 [Elasticomyces elasticus]|nr:hypothetical protein LTR22_002399 [Elasticomyces elasticus]KAK4918836.1 hypothetical protein LTR49_013467 [Elasticomyces elasticus]KAK5758753.1 hypothetical protein LTS12_011147 [Elasticomyces elasticus]